MTGLTSELAERSAAPHLAADSADSVIAALEMPAAALDVRAIVRSAVSIASGCVR
jgi:hypothetical protein